MPGGNSTDVRQLKRDRARWLAQQTNLELGGCCSFHGHGALARLHNHDAGYIVVLNGDRGRRRAWIEVIAAASLEIQLERLIHTINSKVVDRHDEGVAGDLARGDAKRATAIETLHQRINRHRFGGSAINIGTTERIADAVSHHQACRSPRGGDRCIGNKTPTGRFTVFSSCFAELNEL